VLELFKVSVITLESYEVCNREDSKEHERNESESFSAIRLHLVSELSVDVAALTILVNSTKLVKNRSTLRSDNGCVSLTRHKSSFKESLISSHMFVKFLGSLVALALNGCREHSVVRVTEMS